MSTVVNINLLPQKKRWVSPGLYPYIILSVIWLAGAIYLGLLHYSAKQEIAHLNNELNQQEKVLTTAQQKVNQGTPAVTVQGYLELSEKLQHLFYPTTMMMDELAYNLPEKGKLTQLTYNLDGKINLQGRFEKYDDVAAYLHNLQSSSRIIKASVKSITAAPVTWSGPVDTEGKPLSPSLQIVGGNLLPRYDAVFEVLAMNVDVKSLESQKSKSATAPKAN